MVPKTHEILYLRAGCTVIVKAGGIFQWHGEKKSHKVYIEKNSCRGTGIVFTKGNGKYYNE